MADAPRKKSALGTPLVIVSFVLVFFILFDFPKGIRDGTAYIAGLIFYPLIGFGGKFPLLTIFLASIVLVVATTAIRHFLIDWTKTARVQEAMRAFSKEMSEARKSNNTYKLKKLTDSQQEVMSLQAEVQTDQMKPMALTMLLVIPIFAWIGSYVGAPVTFDAMEHPGDIYALVGMDDQYLANATILGPSGGSYTSSIDVKGYPIRLSGAGGDGEVGFHSSRTRKGFSLDTDNAVALPANASVTTVPPETYNVRLLTTQDGLRVAGGAHNDSVTRLLLILHDTEGWRTVVLRDTEVVLTTTGGELYAVFPTQFEAQSATGLATLKLNDDTFTIGPGHLLEFDSTKGVRILPYESKVPWSAHWSYQDRAVLIRWHTPFTHWIALYSLFGIPFGQIAQRTLKLWEYRHVDLDNDGRTAGGV